MSDDDHGPPPETAEAIHGAVRRALVEYGYADCSMTKIADEFEGSQSLLHYHYDTKEGLIAAFLARERERFRDQVADLPADPGGRLDRLLDEFLLLPRDGSPDDAATGLLTAFLELHARAPHSDAIRAELVAYDDLVFEAVRETVASGVESGAFDPDADPEAVARAVLSAHDGASIRRTLDDDAAPIRETLERFVLDEVRR